MITLITILGFINILLILYRLDLGLYFFIALIPFTSLLPSTGIPGLNGTSVIILLLLMRSLSNTTAIEKNDQLLIPRLNKVILLLFIWCVISILSSNLFESYQTKPLISYFEKLYHWFIYILLYVICQRELSSKNKIYFALFAITIGLFAEGAFVAKAIVLSGRLRTYGTIGQSNELALFFSCYFLIPLLLFMPEKRIFYKLFYLFVVCISIFSIASTLSRGGVLVMFFIATGFIVLKYKTKGVFILLIAAAFSGTLYNLLPDNLVNRIESTFVGVSEGGRSLGDVSVDRSSYSRIPLAKAGLIMFSENPIVGKGFMAYPLLVPRYEYGGQYGIDHNKASHNMHVRMLSELGIIGYFLFLRIFYISFRTGLKLYMNHGLDKKYNDLGATLCLISMGFLIGCLFGDRFFRGTLISYFFVISAACYTILVLDDNSRKTREED